MLAIDRNPWLGSTCVSGLPLAILLVFFALFCWLMKLMFLVSLASFRLALRAPVAVFSLNGAIQIYNGNYNYNYLVDYHAVADSTPCNDLGKVFAHTCPRHQTVEFGILA